MTHQPSPHTGTLTSTDVSGSHPHFPYKAAASLNHDKAMMSSSAVKTGTSQNPYTPDHIIVHPTCPANCPRSDCTHHHAHQHPRTHHASHTPSSDDLEAIRESLDQLFGLSGQPQPENLWHFLQRKSVGELMASAVAEKELDGLLDRMKDLPTRLRKVALSA